MLKDRRDFPSHWWRVDQGYIFVHFFLLLPLRFLSGTVHEVHLSAFFLEVGL